MSKSEYEILKSLVGVLEENFPEAEVFQPRYVSLDQFVYINDEETDKADEIEDETTVELMDRHGEKIEDLEQEFNLSTPIVAVDSSSAKLGETDQGIIAAFRIAVVMHKCGEVKIERFGPYIAHFTELNREIYNYFREKVFRLDSVPPPPVRKMPERTRNFLERLAQRYASNLVKDALLLWDGSLIQTIDTPMGLLRDSVELSRKNGNIIIAISKQSWLRMKSGERIVGLLEKEPRACYVYVHDKLSDKIKHYLFGKIFVVKFTPDGFSFRVDVAQNSKEECIEALRLLKGCSSFYNGYPEALRQAHIYAYFTPNEVLALQNMAIDKYDLEVIRAFDIKRHLLAPFG
jgi:hypothetical protein